MHPAECQQSLLAARSGACAGSVADAEASLAAARKVVAQTVIRANVTGTVYSVDVTRTEFAEQGKLLLQLADLSRERVRAYFDEPDIGRLESGQKIIIKWDAKPGQEWHGHIVLTPSRSLPTEHATWAKSWWQSTTRMAACCPTSM